LVKNITGLKLPSHIVWFNLKYCSFVMPTDALPNPDTSRMEDRTAVSAVVETKPCRWRRPGCRRFYVIGLGRRKRETCGNTACRLAEYRFRVEGVPASPTFPTPLYDPRDPLAAFCPWKRPGCRGAYLTRQRRKACGNPSCQMADLRRSRRKMC
jgi:hypothetical protein